MSTRPGPQPSGDDRSRPDPPSHVEDIEEPEEGAAGVEIGTSEREGSTFEPEEDPEAQR
jgi:hypothetical protein